MDVTTAQQRLTEAEAALHNLALGSLEEEITGPDGRHVKFTPADTGKLERYIQILQGVVAPRRPIVFGFGR